jgi:hypothetical protein
MVRKMNRVKTSLHVRGGVDRPVIRATEDDKVNREDCDIT